MHNSLICTKDTITKEQKLQQRLLQKILLQFLQLLPTGLLF